MERLEIPNPWKVILDGKKTGQDNMGVDMELFKDCKIPTVRIYGWSGPCISIGYSQKIEEEIDLGNAQKKGIEIVKRPTGGGVAFHTADDVAYSVIAPIDLFPKGLGPSYYYISRIVLKALNEIGINAEITSKFQANPKLQITKNKKKSSLCFADVMPHEITVGGKKLVGSAQKRGRNYLLQQGAISVSKPDNSLLSVVRNKDEIGNTINSSAFINGMNNIEHAFEMVSETLAETWPCYVSMKMAS